MRRVNFLFCIAITLLAQPGPINLNFQEDGYGGRPKNWASITESGYSTATTDDCRRPKTRCVVLRYEGENVPRDFGWVQQSFDATALRGKQVRYRAWLHIKDSTEGRAQIFVRVDRLGKPGDPQPLAIGFHDYSHDRPVRSRDWTMREVVGTIDVDAVRITIGLMLGGRGSAYFADPEFESIENPI